MAFYFHILTMMHSQNHIKSLSVTYYLTWLVHQNMVCVNISAICPQCKHIDSIFKYEASTGQILLPGNRVIVSMMVGTEDLKIYISCEQVENLIFVACLVLFGNYLPHNIA